MNLDGYVSSAKKIYVSILILFLSVSYFSWIEYSRRNTLQELSLIESLLALYDAAENIEDLARPMAGRDLALFFPSFLNEAITINQTILNFVRSEPENEVLYYWERQQYELGAKLIPYGKVISDVKFRLNPGVSCEYGFFQGHGKGVETVVFGGFMSGGFDLVSGEDLFLVMPSLRCDAHFNQKMEAFLVHRAEKKHNWIIAIPTSSFKRLSSFFLPAEGNLRAFDYQPPKWFEHLPYRIKEKLRHKGNYTYLPFEELERIVFERARFTSGMIHRSDQFDEAVDDLFTQKAAEANVFGIRTDHKFFINCAPLILLLLNYVLYRRLRVIELSGAYSVSEPWIFLRIDTRFDLFICYSLVIALSIIAVTIYVLYADINQISLYLFDYRINPRAIWSLEIKRVPSPFERQPDYLGKFLLWVGLPLQAYLVYKNHYYLHHLVLRSREF